MAHVDPLIHFGFYTACNSAPPLQAYPPDSVREQLRTAAARVLDRTVQGSGNRVWLPRTFHWYEDDFGAREGVLAFVARHLPDDARRQLDSGQRKLAWSTSTTTGRSTTASTCSRPCEP